MSEALKHQLQWLLQPLADKLNDPAITDIHINGPDPEKPGFTRVFTKRAGEREEHSVPLTWSDLDDIAVCAAAWIGQDIAPDAPFCSTSLPDGQRVQIVRPPAMASGNYCFSIRRPSSRVYSPQELEERGVFARARASSEAPEHNVIARLLELKAARRWREMLELAVANRLNIIWAGEVGTGKTTYLKTFVSAIPLNLRLVTVEDMPEIIGLKHRNIINLFYPKGKQSISNHTAEECIEAGLRMDMDWLLMQELRDGAAWAYMRALASGHPGMTSMHAENTEVAFTALTLMAKQHETGGRLGDKEIQKTLRGLIDIVVHCEKTVTDERYISSIYFEPEIKHNIGSVEFA